MRKSSIDRGWKKGMEKMKQDKRLLILNGSHSEIPLIQEAKKLGYYVVTSGNAPELIGHTYADEYVYGDYSDQEKMLEIVKEKDITAVCSCANDFGIITAAYISEQMGWKGHDSYETTLLLHEKHRFKRFARVHQLRTPMADVFTTLEDAVQKKNEYVYPVIVKPVDLTGGKGVSRVDNCEEYVKAVKMALERSIQGKIVVEKFLTGTYHSFSTFLVNEKVIASFSDNEYSFINPYFVATSGGPATDIGLVRDLLTEQVELIARELHLVNGVFHIQYVLSEGEPYIMDITRRCSGDLYPEPVEHAMGIPWAKWIVMSECGYHTDVFRERGEQKIYCGRHCVMAEKNGVVRDVVIDPAIKKNIYQDLLWWKPGDRIDNYLVDKLGILFLEYESEREMVEKIANIKNLVRVVVE